MPETTITGGRSRFLGHASLESTQLYTHLATRWRLGSAAPSSMLSRTSSWGQSDDGVPTRLPRGGCAGDVRGLPPSAGVRTLDGDGVREECGEADRLAGVRGSRSRGGRLPRSPRVGPGPPRRAKDEGDSSRGCPAFLRLASRCEEDRAEPGEGRPSPRGQAAPASEGASGPCRPGFSPRTDS